MSSRTASVCSLVVYSVFMEMDSIWWLWKCVSWLDACFCTYIAVFIIFEFDTVNVWVPNPYCLQGHVLYFSWNTLLFLSLTTPWLNGSSNTLCTLVTEEKSYNHFSYHIRAVFSQHTHKCEHAHAHKIIPTLLPEICSHRPDILLCLRLHWQCFIATLEARLTYKRQTDLHMTINVGNFLLQRLIQVDW